MGNKMFLKKIGSRRKPSFMGTGSYKKAIVFVDFEHWFISLDRLFKTRPNYRAWRSELSEKYDVVDIVFFADFSNPALKAEIPKIREITNHIIETHNTATHHKKDFTDFIMLDQIYQSAMTSDSIDTFIIFTGDGHFSSVVSFLVNSCRKEVGIYGIKNAISQQLVNSANYVVELPREEDVMSSYYQMILKNLKRLENSNNPTKNKKLCPTFNATVDSVAKYNNVNKTIVAKALRELMDKKYIYQGYERIGEKKSIKVIKVDWVLLKTDGIWTE